MSKKILYDEYFVKIKGKEYRILVHSVKDVESNIAPDYTNVFDEIYVDGNRPMLQSLYDAGVTLVYHPDAIVYIPLRNGEYLFENGNIIGSCKDLVMYNFQVQLNRSYWKEIKNIMRKQHPKKYTLKYNQDHIMRFAKELKEKYKKSNAYYKYPCCRSYYLNDLTMFTEGNRELFASDLENILNFKNRTDLEYEALKYKVCPEGYAFGYTLGFYTKKIFKINSEGE